MLHILTRSNIATSIVLLAAIASTSRSSAHGGSYVYTPFRELDSTYSDAVGINNAGDIVGSFFDQTGTLQNYLYSGGSFTTLVVPGSVAGSFGIGINNLGEVVLDSLGVSDAYPQPYLFAAGHYTGASSRLDLYPGSRDQRPRPDRRVQLRCQIQSARVPSDKRKLHAHQRAGCILHSRDRDQ